MRKNIFTLTFAYRYANLRKELDTQTKSGKTLDSNTNQIGKIKSFGTLVKEKTSLNVLSANIESSIAIGTIFLFLARYPVQETQIQNSGDKVLMAQP